jgi:hypothetical protein
MTLNRLYCCLCDNKYELKELLKLPSFPVTFSPYDHTYDKDIYEDIIWGSCVNCGSVQLITLIDPNILYATPHNETSNSQTWKNLHKAFSEFIENNIKDTDSLIEVGGASGNLATLLKDKVSEYIIMDITDSPIKVNVKFIKENCETYNFTKDTIVIMSHVLEHLHEPRKFIENCSKNSVNDIYVAHPIMDVDADFIPIDIEHTYFADNIDIQALFERNLYKLESYVKYNNHSHFLHFKYTPTNTVIINNNRPERSLQILEAFKRRQKILESIEQSDNIYVMPGGHCGQLVYYYSKCAKIIGFLDNDPNKQGKRVYGTPIMTYPVKHIQNVNKPIIIIYGRLYVNELKEQISQLNKTASIKVII